MSACESPPDAVPSSTPGTDPEPALSALSSTAAPVRNPLGPGVEVVCYPVDDSRGSLGRALASYTDRPLPIARPEAESWRARGLRILAVPTDEVERLLQGMPLAGSVQRQTFGALTRWTPVAIGGSWTGSRVIGGTSGIDTGLVLPAGRLRVLARAWDDPIVEPSVVRAKLRVELLPQHEQFDPDLTTLIQAPKRSIDRAGKVFDELALAFHAEPGEVYLIVPESPTVTWRPGDEASNDQPGSATTVDPDAESRASEPASLGEALLSNAAYARSGRVKVVVVLIPRSAGVFNLIPATKPR